LPVYTELSQRGFLALGIAFGLTLLAYPIAYLRKMHQVIEGSANHHSADVLLRPVTRVLHLTCIRRPRPRASFHFISQTLRRVQRYRIYLVLYGGVGLSVVVASVLRFSTMHSQIRVSVSSDGIRVAIAIVVFWIVAGLRMAFSSSGNQRGRWIFRFVHGHPPDFAQLSELLAGAKRWTLLWAAVVSACICAAFQAISPAELRTGRAIAAQALVAAAMCLLLTDAFFLNVTALPFTDEPRRGEENLAFTVLKYFTFFPLVAALPIRIDPWLEQSALHSAILIAAVLLAHWALDRRHRAIVRDQCNQLPLEDDEEDFPMKLGLRY
jgi:hypothetical protein